MDGAFRYIPQDILNDTAAIADMILDPLLLLVPYIVLLSILGGVPRAVLQFRIDAVQGRRLSRVHDKQLRTVPLSVGLWGLILMHVLLIASPRMTQIVTSSEGARNTVEIITMGFAFFTMFGVINLIVRHGLDPSLRKKFNIVDIGVITHLMGALGIGLFAWGSIRWGSIWTGMIGWQHFLDAYAFDFESYEAVKQLPVFAKLHIVVGGLAFGALLHSRMVTHLMIPRPSLWRVMSGGKEHTKVSAAQAAALAYGVSTNETRVEDSGENEALNK